MVHVINKAAIAIVNPVFLIVKAIPSIIDAVLAIAVTMSANISHTLEIIKITLTMVELFLSLLSSNPLSSKYLMVQSHFQVIHIELLNVFFQSYYFQPAHGTLSCLPKTIFLYFAPIIEIKNEPFAGKESFGRNLWWNRCL